MQYDDLPLHTSAEKFAEEKRKCQTTVRNSPPRYSAARNHTSHPYDHTGELDYSLERFDWKKRLHATDVRTSPNRLRSPDDRRSPMRSECGHASSPAGRHTSQKTFAIEKSEHFAEMLPRRAAAVPEPRVMSSYRHASQAELAKEISLCKTPLCPVPEGQGQQESRVVDNYLRYTPHSDEFLHHSCKTLNKEKKGHLTNLNLNPRLKESPAAQPHKDRSVSPARHGLFTSAQDLRARKRRCATELASSNHRSKSAERSVDLSPQYTSNRRFTTDKRKCTTDIHVSPRMGRAPTPERGYVSHEEYRQDKRVHRATPSPQRNPVRSVSASPMRDGHCGHTSHLRFHDEKRLHKTDCHTSPNRMLVREPSSERRAKSPSTFTSRKELERAKRGHYVNMGAGNPAPDNSHRRIHASNQTFSSEKRAHRTAVGNVHTPPSQALSPPGSELRGYTSVQRFSENKGKHRVDTSPMRSGYRDMPSPAYSPMTSNQALQFQKTRHRLEMDSPNRARLPQTPLSEGRSSFSRRTPHERTPDRQSRSTDGGYRDVPMAPRTPTDQQSYVSTEMSYSR